MWCIKRDSLANKRCLFAFILCLSASWSAAFETEKPLSLFYSLKQIKQNDFRLKQLKSESAAHRLESQAADFLPDPTFFAAIQSLPTDTFKLNQEPMTQLRMGVRQMFPKGKVLEIQSDLQILQSNAKDIAQQAHWLTRRKQAEHAWLDAWFWQQKQALLDNDKAFLEQVLSFIRSLYEVGGKEQSDLIGAKLALLALENEKIEASQRYDASRRKLDILANTALSGTMVSDTLPSLAIARERYEPAADESIFSHHPSIALLNQNLALSKKNVDLTNQDFEPSWGLELSYGLRDGNNMDGSQRPDFFSAGFNVQMPIFSDGKQRYNKKAAQEKSQAALYRRDEALKKIWLDYQSTQQQLQHTQTQQRLYGTQILPMMKKQKDSAMQSYQSGKGDFKTLMSLFLEEQQAKIAYQRLSVNEQIHYSALNFLLGREPNNSVTGEFTP